MKLKLKRIDFDNGHLWVTNGINTGDYFFANQAIRKCVEIVEGDYPFKDETGNFHSKHWNSTKILAQTNFNLPNVPFIKIGEEDLNTLSFNATYGKEKEEAGYRITAQIWYIQGYKAAKEKGTYTEEDLRLAFECGVESESHRGKNTVYKNFNEFIQSLNHPPNEIEIEMEFVSKDCYKECAEMKSFKGTEHEGVDMCEDGCVRALLKPVTYTKDNKTYLKIK